MHSMCIIYVFLIHVCLTSYTYVLSTAHCDTLSLRVIRAIKFIIELSNHYMLSSVCVICFPLHDLLFHDLINHKSVSNAWFVSAVRFIFFIVIIFVIVNFLLFIFIRFVLVVRFLFFVLISVVEVNATIRGYLVTI